MRRFISFFFNLLHPYFFSLRKKADCINQNLYTKVCIVPASRRGYIMKITSFLMFFLLLYILEQKRKCWVVKDCCKIFHRELSAIKLTRQNCSRCWLSDCRVTENCLQLVASCHEKITEGHALWTSCLSHKSCPIL